MQDQLSFNNKGTFSKKALSNFIYFLSLSAALLCLGISFKSMFLKNWITYSFELKLFLAASPIVPLIVLFIYFFRLKEVTRGFREFAAFGTIVFALSSLDLFDSIFLFIPGIAVLTLISFTVCLIVHLVFKGSVAVLAMCVFLVMFHFAAKTSNWMELGEVNYLIVLLGFGLIVFLMRAYVTAKSPSLTLWIFIIVAGFCFTMTLMTMVTQFRSLLIVLLLTIGYLIGKMQFNEGKNLIIRLPQSASLIMICGIGILLGAGLSIFGPIARIYMGAMADALLDGKVINIISIQEGLRTSAFSGPPLLQVVINVVMLLSLVFIKIRLVKILSKKEIRINWLILIFPAVVFVALMLNSEWIGWHSLSLVLINLYMAFMALYLVFKGINLQKFSLTVYGFLILFAFLGVRLYHAGWSNSSVFYGFLLISMLFWGFSALYRLRMKPEDENTSQ